MLNSFFINNSLFFNYLLNEYFLLLEAVILNL